VSTVTCRFHRNLPLLLTPRYWLRHGLTEPDLRHILESVVSNCVWLLVVSIGGEINGTAILPTRLLHRNRELSAKPTAIKKVLKHAAGAGYVRDHGPPRLCQAPPFSPGLPLYTVANSTYIRLLHHSLYNLRPDQCAAATYLYSFLGDQWVPRGAFEKGVWCTRVRQVPDPPGAREPAPRSLAAAPLTCTFEGRPYVLTEESVLVGLSV
jgi:hypothetical protein